jgi:hypothetical protein
VVEPRHECRGSGCTTAGREYSVTASHLGMTTAGQISTAIAFASCFDRWTSRGRTTALFSGPEVARPFPVAPGQSELPVDDSRAWLMRECSHVIFAPRQKLAARKGSRLAHRRGPSPRVAIAKTEHDHVHPFGEHLPGTGPLQWPPGWPSAPSIG